MTNALNGYVWNPDHNIRLDGQLRLRIAKLGNRRKTIVVVPSRVTGPTVDIKSDVNLHSFAKIMKGGRATALSYASLMTKLPVEVQEAIACL